MGNASSGPVLVSYRKPSGDQQCRCLSKDVRRSRNPHIAENKSGQTNPGQVLQVKLALILLSSTRQHCQRLDQNAVVGNMGSRESHPAPR